MRCPKNKKSPDPFNKDRGCTLISTLPWLIWIREIRLVLTPVRAGRERTFSSHCFEAGLLTLGSSYSIRLPTLLKAVSLPCMKDNSLKLFLSVLSEPNKAAQFLAIY